VPIYDYRCGCGRRFEVIQSLTAPDPGCPDCGGPSARVPAAPALGGRASAGRSQEYMPQTWRGTRGGNREHLTELRREWAARERLEAKHPELAGDTRPVLAHEGRYHGAPLRAGDPMPGPAAAGDAPGPGRSTGKGHSGGPGHSHDGGPGARDIPTT